LIDANAFSPTSGYPSYIFQALTAAATNATTSLVAITALNWTAQPNSEYLAEWGLLATPTDDLTDIWMQIIIPSGSSSYGNWLKSNNLQGLLPSNSPLTEYDEVVVTEAASQVQVIEKAYIKTGATSGSVEFKYSKNSAVTGSAQINIGSWVRVEKIK
jgi:hypothetical protein